MNSCVQMASHTLEDFEEIASRKIPNLDAKDGKTIFTFRQVIKLIYLRGIQYAGVFQGKKGTATAGFQKISIDLGLKSENFTQVKKKYENLVEYFKSIISPPTGAGSDGNRNTSWIYYELMFLILKDKANINIQGVLDSGNRSGPVVNFNLSAGNLAATSPTASTQATFVEGNHFMPLTPRPKPSAAASRESPSSLPDIPANIAIQNSSGNVLTQFIYPLVDVDVQISPGTSTAASSDNLPSYDYVETSTTHEGTVLIPPSELQRILGRQVEDGSSDDRASGQNKVKGKAKKKKATLPTSTKRRVRRI